MTTTAGPDGRDALETAAAAFAPVGAGLSIREFGTGNINRTFLVTPRDGERKPFLLQRLNTRVFRHPELVMGNIAAVTGHVRTRLARNPPEDGRGWDIPDFLLTGAGKDHVRGQDGSFWRAMRFIGGAHALDVIGSTAHAREVGFALGTFHDLLSDLDPDRLADTLPGFHVTPSYLRHHDRVVQGRAGSATAEEAWCFRFVESHRAWAPVLEEAREHGRLRRRPIHGDPKVNNILLEDGTGRALAMIDLDTVKPGLVQYDIGDCLRSGCNPLGEETPAWERVRFEPDLGRAVLQGYAEVARRFLAPADFDLLPEAIRLIAFELGLRFFTDHLEGDVYFMASGPGHNLRRALVQFRLAESIDTQLDDLRAIVDGLR